MPPKKQAAAKPKKKTVEEEAPVDEEQQRQIADVQLTLMRLKADCEREEQNYNEFLVEREKLDYFWRAELRHLDEEQSAFRISQRELQDSEERQFIELKHQQTKLKASRLSSFDSELQSLYKAGQDTSHSLSSLLDKQNATHEGVRDGRTAVRANQVQNEAFMTAAKLNYDQQLSEARLEFDRLGRDLQRSADQKSRILRDQADAERKKILAVIEERKMKQVQELLAKHATAFGEIKAYFGEITAANLDLIKRVKEEHALLKKRELADSKLTADLKTKNALLMEPLKKMEAEVQRLKSELADFDQIRQELNTVKGKVKEQEKELKKLQFQQEVLIQQLEISTNERNELFKAFQKGVYDVHERGGLQNLVLCKKLEILEDQAARLDSNEYQESIEALKNQISQVNNQREAVVAGFERELAKHDVHPSLAHSLKT
jgi:hypothetical protein